MHGGGHLLTLSMPVSGATTGNEHHSNPPYFWYNIGENGIVDSINFVGKILSSQNMASIFNSNKGRISGCVSDLDCSTFRPEDWYLGIAGDNSGTIEYCSNYTEIPMGSFIGICMNNSYPGVVSHCVNYANMPNKEESMSSGIVMENWSVVEYCMNVGNMPYMQYEAAGIVLQSYHEVYQSYDYDNHVMVVDSIVRGVVQNCINVGDLYMANGAVCGTTAIVVGEVDGSIVRNCLNVGKSAGNFNTQMVGYEDTIVNPAMFYIAERDFTIENCLNVGNAIGGLLNKIAAVATYESYIYDNIYYDKQMCRSSDKTIFEISNNGGFDYDIDSIEHGRLTTQLTGDTPELRAMLGDGWSYAEGRYPVPLGFENDSIALRAATSIFLHVESDDNFEHIDSVASHFTVGTENGVSWSSGDRLSIDGENATILASGSETATASLAGYSFSRSLRLDPITGELVATDCDSYLWNGDEYTASGDYIQVLTAANGCDSIVTLHLTINNSVHYSFTETATSPYIWNGTEYTETGDYTQNFTSANGCDSIVTLHLNILSGISQNGTAEISIFPNPATDILNITSSETISEIEIVNTLGQVVKSIEVNSDSAVCNVEDLKAGVYMVRIHAASATLSQRRFVKE